ncbi:hypothetical protein [Georgenia alba]|uniref:Uncharacterized protein n=1 Tax=Georgenia alba TaxID=2233858 RepID=A0ABW2QDB0_9MICO
MSEQDPTGQQSVVGERRRRRLAERAAQEQAAKAGVVQPLTRRELRRRQLEEQARLEAIATGELPLVDGEGNPLDPETLAAAQEADGQQPGERDVRTSKPEAHGSAPAPEAARDTDDTASDAAEDTDHSDTDNTATDNAGETTTDVPTATDVPTTTGETERIGTPPPGVRAAGSASSALSGPTASSASTPAAGMPSRRSMRDRVADAEAAEAAETAPETPSERTGTGRRPVVRAPHTASGIRSLDSTGSLTGVQPVSRPGPAPAPEEATEATTDPAEWSTAVVSPAGLTAARGVDEPSDGSADDDGRPESATRADGSTSATSASTGSVGVVETGPTASGDQESGEQNEGRRLPTWLTAPGTDGVDRPGGTAVHGPEAVAAAALSADENQEDDLDKPRWSPLSAYSPGSGAVPAQPERRSVRDRVDSDEEPAGSATVDPDRAAPPAAPVATEPAADGGRRNLTVSIIRVVALVLAAIVIGVLIALLVVNQGDTGAAGGLVGPWTAPVVWDPPHPTI